MLDFAALRSRTMTLKELVSGLNIKDLKESTNEMVDHMQELIASCVDADVVFTPLDPKANDRYAANPEDVHLAWNLGHVIAHATASSEESSFLAAELARGIPNHGRSRYEVPWQEMTTITHCHNRLEESRRMRLASLDQWPDPPHLETLTELWGSLPPTNAYGRFVLGLMHDEAHLGQIADIVRQAKAARL